MTTYTLYVNDNGTSVPLESTATLPAIIPFTLTDDVANGDTLPLPLTYSCETPLTLYADGCLLDGRHYTENTSSTVLLKGPLPAGTEMVAASTLGKGSTVLFSTPLGVSNGEELTLPASYKVGAGAMQLSLDGILLSKGVHYTEVGVEASYSNCIIILFTPPQTPEGEMSMRTFL